MKICRVFVKEYPGKQVGEIFDIFSPENHPGPVLSGTIAEVEVADDFDTSIMEANVAEDGSVSFAESAAKVAAKALKTKQDAVGVAYAAMDKDVFDGMEEVFGTRRADSATAYYETWKLMKEKPELFASEGLLADKETPSTALGAPLNTNQKVIDFASDRIAEAEAYSVVRVLRIKQFQTERAAILAG